MEKPDKPTKLLLNESEVAEMLSVPVGSIRRWRFAKTGPKYIKLGNCVRWRPEDVGAYIASLPSEGRQE
ncbi:MAG: helix-turn-helix transcriptional regulator [Bryobacteraceae bacterium]|jgi:predicted DNA-binding transcriptional regulator AlpA